MTIRADASEVSHQPRTPTDWTKPWEDVDGKLDELGARSSGNAHLEFRIALVGLAVEYAF